MCGELSMAFGPLRARDTLVPPLIFLLFKVAEIRLSGEGKEAGESDFMLVNKDKSTFSFV